MTRVSWQNLTADEKAALLGEIATVPVKAAAVATIPNVELLEVGSWDACTPDGSPFEVTTSMIASAIAAIEANDARPPIIKLGHDSSLNDGAPAFGKAVNCRRSDDTMKLTADLAGMPQWLADIAASAYPRRSIEGFFDYTADTGRHYEFVLTAVALLGEAYPAVETLEDIQAAWGPEAPELIAAAQQADRRVAATRKIGDTMPEPVKARTSDDAIWTSFYRQQNDGAIPWVYWIREVYINPAEVVVTNDEDGELYTVAYAIGADDSITFDVESAQMVQIEYAPKTVKAGATRRVVTAGAKNFATREAYASAGVVATSPAGAEEGEDPVADTTDPRLLQVLGLDADATQDDIDAAVTAHVESGTTPEPDPVETPELVAASIPDGTQLVDKAQWAETQKVVAKALRDEETHALNEAVKDKRITAASRATYENRFKADRDGTLLLLTGDDAAVAAGQALPKGAVGSTTFSGHAGDGPEAAASTVDTDRVAAKVAAMSRNRTKGGR